jgi:cytosine/adenosine deaminase-related metal-dependent hydrolase
MIPWKGAVTFVNARVLARGGRAASLRFASRILAIDERPAPRDVVVDLEGAFVLPGLVNAHDHLELNHYGPLKRRDRYENAIDWIDDLRPVIRDDPGIRAGSALPLGARLFVGGLKNLLAGVTTVAHHNPRYAGIDRHVPIRVLKRYGWAHSFSMQRSPVGANGEPGGDVAERSRSTPRDRPFIVHAGEGIDERAGEELERFRTRGLLRSNTLLVHGVAMTRPVWSAMLESGAGLVWCPASNANLFGRTAPVSRLIAEAGDLARVCLGTDSRLTGARDLLEELKVARRVEGVAEGTLLAMVTETAAALLRLPDAGRLEIGGPADLIVVPATGTLSHRAPAAALLAADRSALALVVLGGRPLAGAPAMQPVFTARRVEPLPVRVDGAPKLLAQRIGRRLARSPIGEPGVQISPR